jgi:DNA-directed RNA polymerase subunit K/omega
MIWPKDKLTRFECARLVGARALQVSLGAPILIKLDEAKKGFSPIEIAKEEFKQKIIPITIKRTLPTGEVMVVSTKKAINNWLLDHAGEI